MSINNIIASLNTCVTTLKDTHFNMDEVIKIPKRNLKNS